MNTMQSKEFIAHIESLPDLHELSHMMAEEQKTLIQDFRNQGRPFKSSLPEAMHKSCAICDQDIPYVAICVEYPNRKLKENESLRIATAVRQDYVNHYFLNIDSLYLHMCKEHGQQLPPGIVKFYEEVDPHTEELTQYELAAAEA